MKARDLPGADRRLLRHIGRIDPNPSTTMPVEWEAARRLQAADLVEQVGGPNSPRYRITDAGREALR